MTILPIGCAAPMPDRSAADRPFDRHDLRTMMGAAAYHARRVARSMMLGEIDREDVEQDILLALIERRRFFDPARGAWSAFADRVARQAAQVIADRIGTERRFRERASDPVLNGNSRLTSDAAIESDLDRVERAWLVLPLIRFIAVLPPDLTLVTMLALHEDGDIAEAQDVIDAILGAGA